MVMKHNKQKSYSTSALIIIHRKGVNGVKGSSEIFSQKIVLEKILEKKISKYCCKLEL